GSDAAGGYAALRADDTLLNHDRQKRSRKRSELGERELVGRERACEAGPAGAEAYLRAGRPLHQSDGASHRSRHCDLPPHPAAPGAGRWSGSTRTAKCFHFGAGSWTPGTRPATSPRVTVPRTAWRPPVAKRCTTEAPGSPAGSRQPTFGT